MNIFRGARSYSDAPPRARKALSMMRLDSDAVELLEKAVAICKWPCRVGAWAGGAGEAVAHVGIPSQKVAIYVAASGSAASLGTINRKRHAWEAEGWLLMDVSEGQVMNHKPEALADMLKAAIAKRKG